MLRECGLRRLDSERVGFRAVNDGNMRGAGEVRGAGLTCGGSLGVLVLPAVAWAARSGERPGRKLDLLPTRHPRPLPAATERAMDTQLDLSRPGPLLTPDDLVTLFRLPSRKALEAAVSRGQMPPSIRVGARRRWRRETVRKWIEDQSPAGGAS